MAGWGWGYGTKYLPRRQSWAPSPGSLPGLVGLIAPAMSYTDLGGTVLATHGQGVASLRNPITGNQLPSVQATPTARPLLLTSGTNSWLEFDGVDDGLFGSFPVAAPGDFTVAMAVQLRSKSPVGSGVIMRLGGGRDHYLEGYFNNNGAPRLINVQTVAALTAPPSIMDIDIVLVFSANAVAGTTTYRLAEHFRNGDMREAVTTDSNPVGTRTLLNLGAYAQGAIHCRGRLYQSALINGPLTTPNESLLVNWLWKKVP
jgi:hypothetical protein